MKDDTISRQAAIDAVEFGITFAKVIDKSTGEVKELFREGNRSLTEAIKRIKSLPSAQLERKRGRWKPYRCDMYKCSECGYIYTELTDRHKCGANYCPNCGEYMGGVDDEKQIR